MFCLIAYSNSYSYSMFLHLGNYRDYLIFKCLLSPILNVYSTVVILTLLADTQQGNGQILQFCISEIYI